MEIITALPPSLSTSSLSTSAPRKLERFGATDFRLITIDFNPPPTVESRFEPAGTLTPGATTGNNITFTSSVAGSFLAADVDRELVDNDGGRAVIISITSDVIVQADIVNDFSGVGAIPAGEWGVNGSPVTALNPSISEPEKATVTCTASAASFRSSDIGNFIRINAGIIKITQFTSDTVVVGQILGRLKTAASSPAGTWSLEIEAWSTARGFPRTGGFFEQRLYLAGTPAQPYTFWGSRIGDFENFATGPDDSHAIEFTLATQETNIIRWIVPGQSLLLGTSGEEWEVDGGTTKGITPNNIRVRSHTTHGAANVVPLRIGTSVLFVQRAGKKLRELKFNMDVEQYAASDLMLLNPDITGRSTIVDLAYQQEPFSIVWCVLADGTLLALTYDPQQNIWAWSVLASVIFI